MKQVLLCFVLALAVSAGMAQATLTPIILPRYIQGTTVSGNTNRIPFPFRATVSGLTPNATYRYITRMILTSNSSTNGGAGNFYIVPPSGPFTRVSTQSLGVAGQYAEFTANAQGSYTGWFVLENTSNSTRAVPGVWLQARLILNDGNGGSTEAAYPSTIDSFQVRDFGAAAPNTGAGLRSTVATGAAATNFVFLYDSVAAVGRPIAGAVVEDDGVTTSGYAPWYTASVNGVAGAWGTILPTNLPNGIRRITQFSRSSGAVVGVSLSPTGVWPAAGGGTVSTVNPTGGSTELAIDGSSVTLPVRLASFLGTASRSGNLLSWTTSEEINADRFELQRSLRPDGFETIATLPAQNAMAGAKYSYNDLANTADVYYRLKMLDKDGSFQLSKTLKLSAQNSKTALQILPNPVQHVASIAHQEASNNASFRLLNAQGQVLLTQPVAAGATRTQMNLSQLAAGQYILQLMQAGQETISTTLLKD